MLAQDDHFALAPQMIRQRPPKATIISFRDPVVECAAFSICPWKGGDHRGRAWMHDSGCHTQFHFNNFIEWVDRFLESRFDPSSHSKCRSPATVRKI